MEPQATCSVTTEESKQEGKHVEELDFQDSDNNAIEELLTKDEIDTVPQDPELQQPIVVAPSPTLS